MRAWGFLGQKNLIEIVQTHLLCNYNTLMSGILLVFYFKNNEWIVVNKVKSLLRNT